LRVLMVTPQYLPSVGGVEVHVAQIARRLQTRGIDVTVLSTDRSGTLPTHEQLHGVRVRRVRARPAKRDYYFARRIFHEIVRGDWDLIHVQSFHTFVAPVAMLAALRARLPYVVTFHAGGHSSRLRKVLRPLQLSLLRPLLARADRLIVLARFEIDHYSQGLRIPPERFALISNGSDLPGIVVPHEAGRDPSLIASIGRLEQYKGHHRVIAVLPHLLWHRPDVRLWIAGAGPYEASLKRLTETLGVTDRVEFRAVPGHDREQMARELSRVRVVVSLSEFETQPIAMLEALALGCRLVVAETPGLQTLAEEGMARAVPLETAPADIAKVVLEELEKPVLAEPPALPTWDGCADSVLALYESVVARRSGT
jgi:glycosyltransferase involved in cell wall biosynthesis